MRVFLDGIGNNFSFTDAYKMEKVDKFCNHSIIVETANTRYVLLHSFIKALRDKKYDSYIREKQKCDTYVKKGQSIEKCKKRDSYMLNIEKEEDGIYVLVKYDVGTRIELDSSFNKETLKSRCIESLEDSETYTQSIFLVIGDMILVCNNITCGMSEIEDMHTILIHTEDKVFMVVRDYDRFGISLVYNHIYRAILRSADEMSDNFIYVKGIELETPRLNPDVVVKPNRTIYEY